MAYRITIKNLQALAATLNSVTGSPAIAWRQEDGRNRASIGNYHISGAYGGYCLHRMMNQSGGVADVFSCGHIPARDLFERMHAFMRGFEQGKEAERAVGPGDAVLFTSSIMPEQGTRPAEVVEVFEVNGKPAYSIRLESGIMRPVFADELSKAVKA